MLKIANMEIKSLSDLYFVAISHITYVVIFSYLWASVCDGSSFYYVFAWSFALNIIPASIFMDIEEDFGVLMKLLVWALIFYKAMTGSWVIGAVSLGAIEKWLDRDRDKKIKWI